MALDLKEKAGGEQAWEDDLGRSSNTAQVSSNGHAPPVARLTTQALKAVPDTPAPEEIPATDDATGDPRRGFLRGHPLLWLSSGIALIFLTAAGYLYFDHAMRFETTDDAFIAGRPYAVAPEVSGYLTDVPVTDNQHVKAGDVIARIDERNYRIAVENAKAAVANAEAGVKQIEADISVQESRIASDKAQVEQQQASLVFAQQEAARFQHLASDGFGTVEKAQQYTSQQRGGQAAVDSAQANLTLAQRQIDTLKAQRDSALAQVGQAKAQLDQALLNLSYATVTAAQPGHIVQLTASVGEFAQPGTNLSMFVPDEIWIAANFKETQLDALRPGQPVTIGIDAYPERAIAGHVASVQSGSGTAFSLLPVENATGNYVKIVQRVPVKIIIDEPPSDIALGPGMSVVPTVRIYPTPSLYERLARLL